MAHILNLSTQEAEHMGDFSEFKASLSYKVISRTAKTVILRSLVLKNKTKTKAK